jgi:short-subunit dehydrogenase
MGWRPEAIRGEYSAVKPMNFRGQWVLVTGASSGLGRAMAVILARDHGAHIIAVARREARLTALRDELAGVAGVQVETIVADMSNAADVDRVVQQATSGRKLYAAILNAGVTHFGHHDQLSWASFEAMLHTNVTSVVRMTSELIPVLIKQDLGGGIMLVSSMAGLTPIPYQAAYSGTKAFLINFGCSLWHELQGKNLSITTYAPGGVATEMTEGENFHKLRRWLMPVDAAARDAVESFAARRYVRIPGATNRIGSTLMRFLPQRLVTSQVASSYRKSLLTAVKR